MILPSTTPWLADPDARRVCNAVTDGGFDVYFVGGCVRNAIMDIAVSDIDLSTNARPLQVMDLAKAAGLKAVPTGIDHGTVTVICNGKPFEITTFRRDVETDGRRAVVSFSNEILDDASRRDFTMNALYAKPDGTVVDPLGGLQDAIDRRVRFILDAQMRIREDYLRTLRFFRFVAWYGAGEEGFDAEALDAIASNLEGLEKLSAERVGTELLKLFRAPDPAPSVAAMRQTGVLRHILPGADDRWLALLVHTEDMLSLPPDPVRRLAVMGGEDVALRLRLSKADDAKLKSFRTALSDYQPTETLGYLHGSEIALGVVALRAAMTEMPPERSARAAAYAGEDAVFPVAASDLQPALQGKALGDKLKELKHEWIASGFAKTKDDLLG